VLVLFALALLALLGDCLRRCWDWLVGCWDWLVESERGRFWPVPAAFLPGCIPLISSFVDPKQQPWRYRLTVSLLLVVIAALQIYGQARAGREREAADARINRIGSGVVGIATQVESIAAAFESLSEGSSSQGSSREFTFGLKREPAPGQGEAAPKDTGLGAAEDYEE
jgi:hypothetical protein